MGKKPKNTNEGADCGYRYIEVSSETPPFDTQAPPPGTAAPGVKPPGVEHILAELTRQSVSPGHYKFPGGVQVIDITRHLGFLEGNIIKYVARAGRKNDRREDLLKARQYLDWLLEDVK